MAQQPIKAYFDNWITAIKPDVARTTCQSYRNIARRFSEYLDKEYPDITLSEMDRNIIQEYLNKKLDTGVKGATIKQYYLALHSAFAYAVKMELINVHPMDKMSVPRADRHEASFYNQDELNGLFNVFEGDLIEIVVHIAAYYGLRRCEILGLRHLRFHDLRHSSLLLANDVPMKAIQEWLGHSNFSITANLYSHLEYNAKIASAETIAKVLGGAESKSEVKDRKTNADTIKG